MNSTEYSTTVNFTVRDYSLICFSASSICAGSGSFRLVFRTICKPHILRHLSTSITRSSTVFPFSQRVKGQIAIGLEPNTVLILFLASTSSHIGSQWNRKSLFLLLKMVPPHGSNTLFCNVFPCPSLNLSPYFSWAKCPAASCRVHWHPLHKGG